MDSVEKIQMNLIELDEPSFAFRFEFRSGRWHGIYKPTAGPYSDEPIVSSEWVNQYKAQPYKQ